VPLLLLLPLLAVLLIALIPFSLIQRYRVGTSRQRARGWLINLNIAALTFSAMLFVVGAGFTGLWVPYALGYAIAGLAGGAALGFIGLWLTRWEASDQGLHFTPNRLLVLVITLLVSARIFYGFWRSLHAWHAGASSWLGAAGVADSMAAGAVVLGYYLSYWIGVRKRFRRLPRTSAGTPPGPPRPIGAGRSAGAASRSPSARAS
jgi:hypothetical protein